MFGLKQSNVQGTSFANGTMWLKVFVLWHGLYIAPLGMIFCISQSYTRLSIYTKFHTIWTNIFGTSFVKHQIGQYGVGEARVSLLCCIWLKIGVSWSFGMVPMCVKFHSHWTHIASTCFTMW